MKRTIDLLLSVIGLVLLAPLFLAVAVCDQARLARAGLLPPAPHGRGRPDVRDPQVPDDGRGRRRAEARPRAPEQARRAATRACSRSRTTRGYARRERAPTLLHRRAAAALNVLRGRDEPRRAAAADPRRGPARRRLGAGSASTSSPGSRGSGRCSAGTTSAFEEMVRLDYVYVTTWSLLNDMKLILRTIPTLYRARDS